MPNPIGIRPFQYQSAMVVEQCGDVTHRVVKRNSKLPQRDQPPNKIPAVSGLSQAEAAAYASEFGASPHDPMSENEANVSPYEGDDTVIPRKRFRGLAESSHDLRSEAYASY